MKKVLSLLLVLAMAFSLIACGSGTTNSGGGTVDTDGNDTPVTSDENAEIDNNESKAGTDGDSIFQIGGLGPLTGSTASYGTSVKQGAEIAVKEINAAGGVTVGDTTYELVLNFLDDENKSDVGISAYGKLMDDGINALIGCVTTTPQLAVMNESQKDGILHITPSASAAEAIKYDNIFRLCFTDPLQGETMANYLVTELGVSKIAVLYCNGDDYSTGIRARFEEVVADLGGEIVSSESFGSNDVDFSTQLSTIKASDAEVLFVPSYYQEASNIVKQAYEMDLGLPFYGSDGWDGILGSVTDPTYVEGAIFLTPFIASDPVVADFVAAYEEAYGATPDQFAADGYDCVYVIKAAMEQAGSIDNAELVAAMTEISVKGMTGEVSFGEDGEPMKEAKMALIKDGEYTAN